MNVQDVLYIARGQESEAMNVQDGVYAARGHDDTDVGVRAKQEARAEESEAAFIMDVLGRNLFLTLSTLPPSMAVVCCGGMDLGTFMPAFWVPLRDVCRSSECT